jgi:hypothetical protein
MLYLEEIPNPGNFMSAARRAARTDGKGRVDPHLVQALAVKSSRLFFRGAHVEFPGRDDTHLRPLTVFTPSRRTGSEITAAGLRLGTPFRGRV